MNEITMEETNGLIVPSAQVTTRPATKADVPAIDALQKTLSNELGFMHFATLEGKIERNEVLLAIDESGSLAGYIIGSDTYFKREEVGVVYQTAVQPRYRRGNVGAVLLRALFASWPYGTRLCCAWCAQDLPANKFWEAMGFVPLAYRVGSRKAKVKSRKEPRIHIFWQKRTVEGDQKTPWWYPSITGNGAIREDRLVLPIPEGQPWEDTWPAVLPEPEELTTESTEGTEQKQEVDWEEREGKFYRKGKRLMTAEMIREEQRVGRGGLFMVPMDVKLVKELPKKEKPRKAKKKAVKHDPRLASTVRELRDRWLEHVNTNALLLPAGEKYAVGRSKTLPGAAGVEEDPLVLPMPTADRKRLLPAA